MENAEIEYITCTCGQKIGLIKLGKLGVDKKTVICVRCLEIIEVKE